VLMATYNNGNTSPYASIARYVVERDTFLRGKASRGISIALQSFICHFDS